MGELIRSTALLLALLNPFLLIVYLTDLLETLDGRRFATILGRAGLIATIVFCVFAVLGDAVFSDIIQAEFASFQIFGGVVLLLIGLQFVFRGPTAIEGLRGESQFIAGAVAMPVLIGPGTISASVIIGERLGPMAGCVAVVAAVVLSLLMVVALKVGHDVVRARNEPLVRRYIEVIGRIMALYVGTVAVEMIMVGTSAWVDTF